MFVAIAVGAGDGRAAAACDRLGGPRPALAIYMAAAARPPSALFSAYENIGGIQSLIFAVTARRNGSVDPRCTACDQILCMNRLFPLNENK